MFLAYLLGSLLDCLVGLSAAAYTRLLLMSCLVGMCAAPHALLLLLLLSRADC